MAKNTGNGGTTDTMTAPLRELLDFQAKVQRQVIQYTADKHSERETRDHMGALGLPTKVTVDAGNITGAPIEPPTEHNGTPREDYTAGALAKYDAKALQAYKLRVWQHYRDQLRYGSMTQEQVFTFLGELGFILPEVASTIQAYVPDGFGSTRYVTLRATGDVSQEDAEAALAAEYPSTVAPVLRRAFPNAVEDSLPTSEVDNVSVQPETRWNDAERANGLR